MADEPQGTPLDEDDDFLNVPIDPELVNSVLRAREEEAVASADAKKAEAEKARAEARKAHAEAERAEIAVREAAIKFDQMHEKRIAELADDDHHHVLQFDAPVMESTVRGAINILSRWDRTAPECDIEIVFTSPGGNMVYGLALYDFIRSLSRKGHMITTRSRGYAASMAGILLQAGDTRIMEQESWLLIHRGQGGAIGSMGEIEDTVDWYKKMDERVLEIFYENSRESERPLSKKALRARYDRKDWWISSDEALRHGFCDEVE